MCTPISVERVRKSVGDLEDAVEDISVLEELKPILLSVNFWSFSLYFWVLSTRIKAIQGVYETILYSLLFYKIF